MTVTMLAKHTYQSSQSALQDFNTVFMGVQKVGTVSPICMARKLKYRFLSIFTILGIVTIFLVELQ